MNSGPAKLAAAQVDCRVLGDVEVRCDDRPVNLGHVRQRLVFVALLVDANTTVSVDQLAFRVWADSPPPAARQALHSYLSRLRSALALTGFGVVDIVRRVPGYRLTVDPLLVDMHRFHRLLTSARTTTSDEDAIDLFDRAFDEWRGPPFNGLENPWLDALRDRLAREHFDAELERTDVALRVRRVDGLAARLSALADDHPFNERLAGQLMLTRYLSGDVEGALTQFQRVRRMLATDLGLDPGSALQQLHQQILAADPALRPAAARAAPITRAIPRQLPADASEFVGRAHELRRLDEHAQYTGSPVVAVSGMAGVGKTALATHWAHCASALFPDGVFFVSLYGHGPALATSPIDALTRVLLAFGVPLNQVPTDEDQAVAQYRSTVAGKRFLLVLDDARSAEQVRPLIPGSPPARMIVTSRERLSGLVACDGAREVRLGPLAADEAVDLIGRMVGAERVAAEPDATNEVASLCGMLPLTIRIAAAHLMRSASSSIGRLAAALRHGNRLAQLQVSGDCRASVAVAFESSYSTLDPETQGLFRALSLLPVPEFGLSSVAALIGLPVDRARPLIDRLVSANLALDADVDRYTLHDLLREYSNGLASTIDRAPDTAEALRRVYEWYFVNASAAARMLYPQLVRLPMQCADETLFDSPAAALAWLRAERTNLIVAATSAARLGLPDMAWRLADALRGFFMSSRDSLAWLTVARAGLSVAELDDHAHAQAACHLSLCMAFGFVGDYPRAVSHAQQARRFAAITGWLQAEASALGKLGVWSSRLGHTAQAASYMREAMTIDRRLGNTPSTAVNLNNLGALHIETGRVYAAQRYLHLALAMYRSTGSRRGEASALINLGSLYQHLGSTAPARDYLETASRMYRELADVEGEAVAWCHLATVELAEDRACEALTAARTALAMLRRTGDLDAEATALNTLASIRQRLGRHRLAMAFYRRALRCAEQAGSRRPAITAMIGIAELDMLEGRLRTAVSHAEHAGALARDGGYQPLERQVRLVLRRCKRSAANRNGAPGPLR